MKRQTRLTSEQQQQQAAEHQTNPQSGREFATAEELLRFDAAQTIVPPAIAQRLQKSSAELPKQKPAWWKRFLGGTNP
jgi:hypothetical protein